MFNFVSWWTKEIENLSYRSKLEYLLNFAIIPLVNLLVEIKTFPTSLDLKVLKFDLKILLLYYLSCSSLLMQK